MQHFFTPKRIAVVGVSKDATKVGNRIFKELSEEYITYPVNHRGNKILGKKVYRNISDLPDKIDLAIIALPEHIVIRAVKDCGKKKIRNMIIVSSGFSDNKRKQHLLKQVIKKYDLNVLGPHSLGVIDTDEEFDMLFPQHHCLSRPQKGSVSIITQSGTMGLALLDYYATENIGLDKFIDVGGEAGYSITDALNFIGKEKRTKVICIYLENLIDAQSFITAAKKIKKPILVLKGGRTTLYPVYKGAFEQAGIGVVESVQEMVSCAKLLEKVKKPKGRNILIISNSRAYALVAEDMLQARGIPLASLTKETTKFLQEQFKTSSPIDLGPQATEAMFEQVVRVCRMDKNVDILFLITIKQCSFIEDITFLEKYTKGKPIIVISPEDPMLEEYDFPVYSYIENATRAIKWWA